MGTHSSQFNIQAAKTMFHSSISWITPSVADKHCNSTALAFSVPLHISICPYCLKWGQRDAGVGNMLLQPCLGETHFMPLPKLQICLCRRFKFIHLIWKISHIATLWQQGELFKPPLSLSSLCATASPLQLIWGSGSQCGYDLASWIVNQLLILVNNSLVAVVTYHNRW